MLGRLPEGPIGLPTQVLSFHSVFILTAYYADVSSLDVSNVKADFSTVSNITKLQNGVLLDRHGNTADKDSNMKFALFPIYHMYKTESSVYGKSLLPFFAFARSVALGCFSEDYPFEMAASALRGDVLGLVTGMTWPNGLWVLGIALGCLLTFLIVILCFLLCFLHFCDHCHPKDAIVKTKCKLLDLGVSFGVLAIMTGVGCLLTLEVHSLMPWVFLRSIGNFKSGLKDIRVFANTLVDEIDFTFAKMHFAKEVFIRDMDNIGNTMGSYIREDLEAQSEIGAVIRNLKSLGNITQQASAAANRLKEAYETFKASAKALADACPNCTHPPFSLIDSIDSGPVTTGLEQLVQRNISKLVDEAAVELHNIPNKTAEAAGSVADTLKDKIGSELNSTRVLKDIVRGARDGLINSLPSGKTVVDNVERIKGVSDIVRYCIVGLEILEVGVAFTAVLAAICALNTGFGHWPKPPDASYEMFFIQESSGKAHTAGRGLRIFTVAFVLPGWLLMMVATVFFVIGPLATKVLCEPIEDSSFATLDKLVEEHVHYGDRTFLADRFNLTDSNLTISSVLRSCKESMAMFTAFELEKRGETDITAMLDIGRKLNIPSQINSALPDIKPFKVIDSDVETFLSDLQRSETEWNDLSDEMEKATQRTSNVTRIYSHPTYLNHDIREKSQDLDSSIKEVESAIADFKKTYQIGGISLGDRILFIKSDAFAAEMKLKHVSGLATRSGAEKFQARLLRIVDTLTNETLDDLRTRHGQCRPLYK
ncbi:hypothetical protein BaRGS_00022924, partial [Batillaria attramentaria]